MRAWWAGPPVGALLCALPAPAPAQQAEGGAHPADQPEEAQALAQQLTNPVADLVSIPFQFNWENGVGENEDLRFVLNVQPVIPLSLGEDWNLILRWILPFVAQPPGIAEGSPATFGTGDIVASAFFSPAKGKVIWGVGPVLGLPTGNDPLLNSGTWSAGPTGVFLVQAGPWTAGALANHLWSFADTGEVHRRDVNQTFLQPFVACTTGGAVTFTVQSESTFDWEAEEGQGWTVPVSALVSKLAKLGPFPFSIQGGAGWYAATPAGGPEWRLRLNFVVLLPVQHGH
ncbi:neuromedin U [Vulgatibacter sp.]|uniref:neuromedin U n=1 Tax=Vulgatibacter sp. TaxID=1971226 RepID=UPI003564B9F7